MPESLFFTATAEAFKKIPGSPIAYWCSPAMQYCFYEYDRLENFAVTKQGLSTSDNNKFVRIWYEVSHYGIGFSCKNISDSITSNKKWFPFNKGGSFRRWAGNTDLIVNWGNNGAEIKNSIIDKYPYLNGNPNFVAKNQQYYFLAGITWSALSSSSFAARLQKHGFIFADKGQALFPRNSNFLLPLLCLANSKVYNFFLKAISPTLDFNAGYISKIPCIIKKYKDISKLISMAQSDWDAYETSWDFQSLPLLRPEYRSHNLPAAYAGVRAAWQAMTEEMQRLEEENNRVFIEAYGLQDELTPDVPLKEITLTCNPFYRYRKEITRTCNPYRAEQADAATRTALEDRLRADSVKELLSYAIGCMMGRYSLDAAGLVYAAAGNAGFDAGKYTTFPADEDGIVPLGDMPWFDDDAAHRFREFCLAVWGEQSLEENLRFVAAQLDPKRGETPEATIRRWLSGKFFKDWHCKVYQNRPIYWLFSSGKHKAFECLVYLHRFNSNTLPRMRAAYVTPLQGKIAARLELLEREEAGAGSTSSRNALKKQRELLLKKQDELRHFDDLLRHYADQNIQLDLDDGVKVNYAKLADLLAESKTITGGKEE